MFLIGSFFLLYQKLDGWLYLGRRAKDKQVATTEMMIIDEHLILVLSR